MRQTAKSVAFFGQKRFDRRDGIVSASPNPGTLLNKQALLQACEHQLNRAFLQKGDLHYAVFHMQYSTKACLSLFLLAAIGATSQPAAQGQLLQLTSPAQLMLTDVTTPRYSSSNSPLTLSAGGNTVTFTALGGTQFSRFTANGINQDFPSGTSLLETLQNTPDGPLRLDFAHGVGEFGLSAQSGQFDFETFTFTAFDGAITLGAFTTPSTDNTSQKGASLFLGARATGGNVITSVLISDVSTVANNDIIIGPVTFSATVPEPGTLALLVGMGLNGSGFACRRLRRRVSRATFFAS